jgi:transcriptional repressor NrdR
VIKTSGRREPFEREKITRGISRAIEKLDISQAAIEEIINSIELKADFYGGIAREIPSSKLGDFVLGALHDLDKVAYIRFASVYKNFTDLKSFLKEIKHLKK